MLNNKETKSLLSKLCIDLGFCLLPEDERKLIEMPPDTVEEFTDAVFRMEGLNPQNMERHLYRKVRDNVAEAFQKHLDNEEYFDK